MEFDRTADTLNACSVDVQSIKMSTVCSCFTVVGVLFSLWCSKKTRTVVIFTCIVISFVRWRHIIFQYIYINCDFTLTMKLAWFLLNFLWLCMTNMQAVELWPVVWPCTMHLEQHKRESRHWRHSSMTSFFIVVPLSHCAWKSTKGSLQ